MLIGVGCEAGTEVARSPRPVRLAGPWRTVLMAPNLPIGDLLPYRQTNPSVTTTTTTQYDTLGRVVSVQYSDGTPAKTLVYDTASTWPEANQQTVVS